MLALHITQDEIDARTIRPDHLQAAVKAVRQDGLVVLNNVVAEEHLDLLHARMVEDLELLQSRPDAPFNWNTGNIQQDPPPFPPFLFRDVLVNDVVVAVTQAILGKGVKNAYYSGNTALNSTERQPVHVDTGQLWANLAVAHPAFGLVVNVPTVDMTAENGSTEIWPGTHLDTTISVHDELELPAGKVERRRAEAPPIQPTVRRGAALIRDLRLWHAGMPNRTTTPRPMIAMIHYARWMDTGTPLRFPAGTEPIFADSPLRTCARFVDEPIDYIRAPQAYKYGVEG